MTSYDPKWPCLYVSLKMRRQDVICVGGFLNEWKLLSYLVDNIKIILSYSPAYAFYLVNTKIP